MAKIRSTKEDPAFPQLGGGPERYQRKTRSGEPKFNEAGKPEMRTTYAYPALGRAATRLHAVGNVIHAISTASPEHIAEGKMWYPRVHEEVSSSLSRRGFLSSQPDRALAASGLVAAVSPNADWEKVNTHALRELAGLKSRQVHTLVHGQDDEIKGMVSSMAIGRAPIANLRKTGRILQGEDPEAVLPRESSPKVNSFMHNIYDPSSRSHVTIDGRMFDVLTNRGRQWESKRGISKGAGVRGTPSRYEHAEGIVTEAADAVGLDPSAAQSVAWLHGQSAERMGQTRRGTDRIKGVNRVGQPYFHPQTGEPVFHLGKQFVGY